MDGTSLLNLDGFAPLTRLETGVQVAFKLAARIALLRTMEDR